MKKIIIFTAAFIFAAFNLSAENFDSFKNDMDTGFGNEKKVYKKYRDDLTSEFEQYKRIMNEEFEKYKLSISEKWGKPVVPAKKKWVEYSPNFNIRRMIDFDKEEITVQIIASDGENVEAELEKQIEVIAGKTEKSAYISDPVAVNSEKRIKKLTKKTISAKLDNNNKIFAPVLTAKPNPTNNDIRVEVEKLKKKAVITSKPAKTKGKHVYTLKTSMKKGGYVAQAQQIFPIVKKYAQKEKIPTDLIFAVIHTESKFNPRAKSYVPAYGLMQIVPRSAGKDATKYLNGKAQLLMPSYLYKTENNVKIGTAYLHILYYKYLGKITNKTSRLYCTIAAYNTGAGNVAYAYNKNLGRKYRYSISTAAKKINQQSPQTVFSHLRGGLRFAEARNYLMHVNERMKMYR